MQPFTYFCERFLDVTGSVLWGGGMLSLFFVVGILFTVGTRFFQVRKVNLWLKGTLGEALHGKRGNERSKDGSITQFQALTGALAAAIGTGNIVGVAVALTTGGAGAIFWMWVSSFFGMMTSYAEKLLGIRYRYKDENGQWVGGAMVYMEKGLKSHALAKIYAFLCVLTSFGMGNLSQSNSIAQSANELFGVSPLSVGIVTAVLIGVVIIGGIKRIAAVTEKLIPFMAFVYLFGGCAVIFVCRENLLPALKSIFSEAFTVRAITGGAGGYLIYKLGLNKNALRTGVSIGVFSNEAGLGSSVIMHCQANAESPAHQGLWGIFEVFADTTVVCSVTALAILCSGAYNQDLQQNSALLCAESFSAVFGAWGGKFVSVSIILFAFATLIGWSYYGERAVSYLFGERVTPIYKVIFSVVIIVGSVVKATLAWTLSEQINALMAVPNLIALILLSGDVFRETKRTF